MRGSIQAFHAALRAGRRAAPTGASAAAEVLEWCEAATARASAHRARRRGALRRPRRRGPARSSCSAARASSAGACSSGCSSAGSRSTAAVRRAHSLPPAIQDAAPRRPAAPRARAASRTRRPLARAVAGARRRDPARDRRRATLGGQVQRAMVDGSLRARQGLRCEHRVERFVYVSSIAALYLGADAGREVGDGVGARSRARAPSALRAREDRRRAGAARAGARAAACRS